MERRFILFKQTEGYCGPAAIRTALSYFNIFMSEDHIAKIANADRSKGTYDRDMVNAIKKIGLNAFAKRLSSIDEIKKLSNEGYPVIVDWFSPKSGGHYSVVAGFEGDKILIADPHYGKIIKYNINWFNERWFDVVDDKLILREIIVIKK